LLQRANDRVFLGRIRDALTVFTPRPIFKTYQLSCNFFLDPEIRKNPMNAQLSGTTVQALPPFIGNRYPEQVKPKRRLNSREDFLAAAREIVPVLRAHSTKTSDLRRPADESVEAIVSSGLLGLLRPKRYGGAGLELSDMIDVAAVLAEGCGSTAWDYDVWEAHNWILGMLPKEGQDEVFKDDAVTICCGVANPSQAKSRAVEGGYMLSGRWTYASGSTHSNWASVGAVIQGRQTNGAAESRFHVVPREHFKVLDTWRSRGLSGTGTHDLYIDGEVFVPEHMTMTRADIVGGTTPGAKMHDSVAYRLPLVPAVHLVTAATAVGTAYGTIEVFKDLMKKRTFATGQKQIDVAASAIRLGTAIIDTEAAHLLLSSTIRELEETVRAGRAVTVELRAKARMVAGYVPDACKRVVTSLVSAGGVGGMAESSALSAALLDVTTMSLHMSTEYDRGPENYGRVVLGLEPSNLHI
jgi:3-hydroxy-9,10-secoandrosta-1,3,5(10)-triene-9,17-dione monooxygenase